MCVCPSLPEGSVGEAAMPCVECPVSGFLLGLCVCVCVCVREKERERERERESVCVCVYTVIVLSFAC